MKKIICILIFYILMLLLISRCNIVIDKTRDREMTNLCTNESYADYCKPIGACTTGTHVMCEAYRVGQVMGHYCDNGRMIKFMNATKVFILYHINKVRAEIVAGKVHGKDDMPVPRGYGLRRLQFWDRDLAIFAQVWANQCRHLKEDECRATKRFFNPGQMVHVTKFPIANKESSPHCVTHELVLKAILISIESWKVDKVHTTKEMVMSYTDIKIDHRFKKNYFLMMGNNIATHVGCGMSGYNYYDKFFGRIYALLLVCNFSHQASHGEQSFKIEQPPISEGYSDQCGCPPGSYEDNDCLCVGGDVDPEVPSTTTADNTIRTETTNDRQTEPTNDRQTEPTNDRRTEPTNDKRTEPTNDRQTDLPDQTSTHPSRQTEITIPQDDNRNDEKTSNKGPAVLILPIITVADTPPEKYQQQMRSINKKLQGYSRKVFSSKNILSDINKYTNLEKPPISNKTSIFTMVPTFHLPTQNNIQKQEEKPKEPIVLKNKLMALLEQVPTKLLSRLEDALETLKQKRDRDNKISTTLSPILTQSPRPIQIYNEVILADGEALLEKNVDEIINKYGSQNKNVDDLIKQIEHGLESSFIPSFYRENYLSQKHLTKQFKASENILNNDDRDNKKYFKAFTKTIQNGNPAVETLSLRKQFPITHVNKNNKHLTNNYKRNESKEYRKVHTGKAMAGDDKTLTYYGNHDKMNDYNSITADNTKSKRKMYLENEINKLKRKLQYLRQYIRRNDISERDHFRPMVTQNSYNGRVKSIDADHFYLPDRAHSLHDV